MNCMSKTQKYRSHSAKLFQNLLDVKTCPRRHWAGRSGSTFFLLSRLAWEGPPLLADRCPVTRLRGHESQPRGGEARAARLPLPLLR